MNVNEIAEVISSIGGQLKGWKEVSERPGKAPFAKESEYEIPNLITGKIHLRNNGDLYVFVVSKDVFNWKNRVKELKLKGEVVDAAGGMMWITENRKEDLLDDLKYLRNFLENLRTAAQQKH
ncbi:hypothetical protein [Sulfuracidifex tepidarius]|uniref:Succinate dehydrogenase subunit D n=1 Tax=Sulfuracidifex tepidarius TaxID=1294262 RepID=A0A510DZX2_9CREN|nr:hypothetical protein [Sulfuracidifex tepidarius]BBG25408.1 hypothetical protein IC006_2744 [Sulfuracidifex tepidarius]BBG28202.1 hypothetical protein IC007_2758 [Sulfuracidifex tepidarius]